MPSKNLPWTHTVLWYCRCGRVHTVPSPLVGLSDAERAACVYRTATSSGDELHIPSDVFTDAGVDLDALGIHCTHCAGASVRRDPTTFVIRRSLVNAGLTTFPEVYRAINHLTAVEVGTVGIPDLTRVGKVRVACRAVPALGVQPARVQWGVIPYRRVNPTITITTTDADPALPTELAALANSEQALETLIALVGGERLGSAQLRGLIAATRDALV